MKRLTACVVPVIFLQLFCCVAKARITDSLHMQLPLTFRKTDLIIPVSLIGTGSILSGRAEESLNNEVVEKRNEHLSHLNTPIDNYLQYAPIGIAYSMDALGIRSHTDITNRTVILAKGELLLFATVSLLKTITHEPRPDGSAYNSFPSGHTGQAFAAAAFLSEEYKYKYPWIPYAAYGMASCTGALRMANNRHYICDVLVGAGLGILSMKLAYWTHRYQWGKHNRRNKQPGFTKF